MNRMGWVFLFAIAAWCFSHASNAEEQVFFGNLHSHTSYSDGSGTPAQAYSHARDKAQLNFLAITEHNHRQCEAGAKDRKDGKLIGKNPELYTGPSSSALIPTSSRYTKSNQFVALYGQEFSTVSKGNHVNVFDVGEVIDDRVVTNGGFKSLLSWLESHPDSTGQKAIIQFNHAKDFDDYRTEYGADDFSNEAEWIAKMSEHVSLFEMLNGPAMATGADNRSTDVMETDFDHYLLLGFQVAPTGDQDNHFKTWGTATDARTGVITDELTKPKLLEALRARHAYATEDKNLRIVFKVNDRLCGDVLPAPRTDSELDISYTIQDEDEPDAAYRIEVHSGSIGGDAVQKLEIVNCVGDTVEPGTIQDIRYSGPSQFIYFKVVQSNEEGAADRAWTAPVWFAAVGEPIAVAESHHEFIASRNSSIYHVSADCRSAKSIKEVNRITGAAAKAGRTEHEGCPIH